MMVLRFRGLCKEVRSKKVRELEARSKKVRSKRLALVIDH